MAVIKRGRKYWLDARIKGVRHREPLDTTDWREALSLEKAKVAELTNRPVDLNRRRQMFGSMTIPEAITNYCADRRAQVSRRMLKYWGENGRRLQAVLGNVRLKHLTIDHLTAYQNQRTDEGRAPKTINGELSVLRQLLRYARLWYRFEEDYQSLKNTKPPVGQALTDEEQQRLFAAARSRPEWIFAYVAAALSF